MIPAAIAAALRSRPSPVCAYVYDRSVLRATAAAVRAALPTGTALLYAVKANSHPEVVATLADHVDGLDVASGGELALAREVLTGRPAAGTHVATGAHVAAGGESAAGVGGRRRALIAFAGPAKTDAELSAAIDAGAVVHVESLLELRRLAHLATHPRRPGPGGEPDRGRGGRAVRVALRVNRSAAGPAGTHAMAGAPTPFGIDEAALPEAAALLRGLGGLEFIGYHLHAVSNSLDAAEYAAFVRDAVAWAVATARRSGMPLRYVNTGGGFGVDYTGATRFDLGVLRDGLAGPGTPDGMRLAVEPGRYLVAAAGWYAAEVVDLKRTHGRWFAVLRGGTHHFRLPAAWGYSHPFSVLPVDAWPYPFERPEVRGEPVDAVGELCTPRDVLTRGQPVDRVRVGDVLVFGNAGGYGWDISHHDFLRHPYPDRILAG